MISISKAKIYWHLQKRKQMNSWKEDRVVSRRALKVFKKKVVKKSLGATPVCLTFRCLGRHLILLSDVSFYMWFFFPLDGATYAVLLRLQGANSLWSEPAHWDVELSSVVSLFPKADRSQGLLRLIWVLLGDNSSLALCLTIICLRTASTPLMSWDWSTDPFNLGLNLLRLH